MGTLDSIERFNPIAKTMIMMDLKIPTPLRRMATMKISQTKLLLLGGVTVLNKEVDGVLCMDLEEFTADAGKGTGDDVA